MALRRPPKWSTALRRLLPCSQDTGDFFICDGAGTYVARTSGWWCPINYTPTTRPNDCHAVSFERSFSLRAAKTTARVKPATQTLSLAKTKSMRVSVLLEVERSTGMFPLADEAVTLQYQKGSRWVKWDKDWTDSRGKVPFKVRFAESGKFKFRAGLKGQEYYAGAVARTVTVRVTR